MGGSGDREILSYHWHTTVELIKKIGHIKNSKLLLYNQCLNLNIWNPSFVKFSNSRNTFLFWEVGGGCKLHLSVRLSIPNGCCSRHKNYLPSSYAFSSLVRKNVGAQALCAGNKICLKKTTKLSVIVSMITKHRFLSFFKKMPTFLNSIQI